MKTLNQPCALRPPLDPVRAAFFWRSKAYTLLKVDVVPDWDRDGVIDDADRDKATDSNPFRFWVNDDNDSGEWGFDDIPNQGSDGDAGNAQVDGLEDLIDFFPLFFDLEEVLSNFDDLSTVDLKLSGSSLRFMQFSDQFGGIDPSDSRKYLSHLTYARDDNNFWNAPTVEIGDSSNPTSLGAEFVNLAAEGKGILLLEGTDASEATNPLKLHFFVDGNELFTFDFPIKLSPVEDMYRHVDLRGEVTEYDGTATTEIASPNGTQTADPGDAYPDALTNGKYFVMVHGCCTDEQAARGTHAEIFKRMHQFGSKARYVGVVWDGEENNDYHKEVFQAFQTGDELADALSFANGDVTVAGHSLGNMVVSHAIQNGGFRPDRYYLINAAVASEAFFFTQVEQGMVEKDWKNIPHRLNAGEWHKIFEGTSDERKDFRWRNFFAAVAEETIAINFYSEGDEVLAEMPNVDEESVLDRLWTWRWNFARGAWKAQELAKGKIVGATAFLSRRQSGWNFNTWQYAWDEDWSTVTNEDIKTTPVFDRFLENKLTDSDVSVASNEAEKDNVRYDVLARAIPALSYATAVGPIGGGFVDNWHMGVAGRAQNLNGAWPTEGHDDDDDSVGDWLHSDFKNNAIHFVYPMYEEMINRGVLDED
ncbi:MAG: hypothetical protein GVY36_02720 [Verrucomicrobia bacterium]|nr:hypothetical protein [Verrucomicrobiota bacterium]